MTPAKGLRDSKADFGHLLLSIDSAVRYHGIRVDKGFLGFHVDRRLAGNAAAKIVTGSEHALWLDLGPAVVCCAEKLETSLAGPAVGDLIFDAHGLSIAGLDDDNRNPVPPMWVLATGKQNDGALPRIVISKWQVGVQDADGKFVALESFPTKEAWAIGSL